jgi:hypothetical protein
MFDEETVRPMSESGRLEAVRRIRECEDTGQTWLDLAGVE